MSATNDTTKLVEEASKYKYGFTTNIEQELAPKGLDKQIVKFISEKKNEPSWLLDWRLKAFESLEKREERNFLVGQTLNMKKLIFKTFIIMQLQNLKMISPNLWRK